MSREAHEKRLKSRNMYSDGHIQDILNRTEMYSNFNQEHPGFFDFMINSGELYPKEIIVQFKCSDSELSEVGATYWSKSSE